MYALLAPSGTNVGNCISVVNALVLVRLPIDSTTHDVFTVSALVVTSRQEKPPETAAIDADGVAVTVAEETVVTIPTNTVMTCVGIAPFAAKVNVPTLFHSATLELDSA